MRGSGALLATLWLALLPVAQAQAQAQDQVQTQPLSAIDWLTESVAAESAALSEEPVTETETDTNITVTTLGGTRLDGVGLFAARSAGLPANLWGQSDSATVAQLIAAQQTQGLPALRDLLFTVLLSELNPPFDAENDGDLLLSRVDKLLEFGALDPASALLDQAGHDNPALFRRWFDVSLLIGREDEACLTMQANPKITLALPARIFCLARQGDWNAAALTLNSAQAIKALAPEELALVRNFLDIDGGNPDSNLPSPITPLVFRMTEAVGEPLPTFGLPLAFSVADIQANSGWKPQIEAAERLARSGALQAPRLMDIYNARKPAASGGVWDRVAVAQRLNAATRARDSAGVSALLLPAWQEFQRADMAYVFAQIFGPALVGLPLVGDVGGLAFDLILLSDGAELAARDWSPGTQENVFLRSIALGQVSNMRPEGLKSVAIWQAFQSLDRHDGDKKLIDDGKLGEAILRTILRLNETGGNDPVAITRSLAFLRSIGLERIARATALQILLLDGA